MIFNFLTFKEIFSVNSGLLTQKNPLGFKRL